MFYQLAVYTKFKWHFSFYDQNLFSMAYNIVMLFPVHRRVLSRASFNTHGVADDIVDYNYIKMHPVGRRSFV